MSSKIIIRPKAALDLAEHSYYIARRNRTAGFRFQQAVERAFDLLARMPGIGSEWFTTSARYTGIRSWTIGGFKNYVIVYRTLDDGIEFIRVIHGRRDLPRVLDDDF